MPVRTAEAVWEGNLHDGKGTMHIANGVLDGPYTYDSRFESGAGTNPEELIAAAHSGCFSMALSGDLFKAGFTAAHIHTTAHVTLGRVEGKTRITGIHLETEARVPGINDARFQEIAASSKQNCPVSVALASVPITLTAKLVG